MCAQPLGGPRETMAGQDQGWVGLGECIRESLGCLPTGHRDWPAPSWCFPGHVCQLGAWGLSGPWVTSCPPPAARSGLGPDILLPLPPAGLARGAVRAPRRHPPVLRMVLEALQAGERLTPVFLPGESQGRGSLVGCSPWGRTLSSVLLL